MFLKILSSYACICFNFFVPLRRFFKILMNLRAYTGMILLFFFSLFARGEELVVDRQAEDFVTVSLLVCEPYEVWTTLKECTVALKSRLPVLKRLQVR